MNIKQEIAELKTRLEQLENECKAVEESEWPRVADVYYAIYANGNSEKCYWEGDSFDRGAKALGNIFETKQEAEAEVEARKVIAELRATGGRVNPFNNSFDNYGLSVLPHHVEVRPNISDVGLFWASASDAKEAILRVGSDRIIAAFKHLARI